MKRLFLKVADFFRRLFHRFPVEYFDLLDEYKDEIRGLDVTLRDTLVGAVRSIEQYRVNYENDFYHIPTEYVDDPNEIKYIALYRSKNIFDQLDAGINHFGTVISYDRVLRRDITEIPTSFDPDKEYYRFNVSGWKCLDQPVKAREVGPRVCHMTNLLYLRAVQYCYELYFTSNEEFMLHVGLTDIVNGVYDGFFVGGVYVRFYKNKIIVTAPKMRKVFLKDEYKRHTLSVTQKISELVFGEGYTS